MNMPPSFVRQLSSRVSGSFRKSYGDRWVADDWAGDGATLNTIADSNLSPKERWWRAFIRCDPRRHLAEYFRSGDERGPYGYLRALDSRPTLNGPPSQFFSVWRPTSLDAMRMLFEGTAVGKALNIKGKSALRGPLTGFVPFLQIDNEEHKKRVRISPPDARARIFYMSWAAREVARTELVACLEEMKAEAGQMDAQLEEHKSTMTDDLLSMLAGDARGDDSNWGGLVFKSLEFADAGRDLAFRLMQVRCTDPSVYDVDSFAARGLYGLDVPERLLWEAYVTRQDITPSPGTDNGRPSEPAFQDLNLQALRDRKKPPAVALWQHDHAHPMNPRTLLMAHEEKHVRPVASDMDPFLIGWKGVAMSRPMPAEQIELLQWTVEQIGCVLAEPRAQGWNKRWLGVLRGSDPIARKGIVVPTYGFGDPQTYEILAKVIHKVEASGAVRHGAEAFNFHFPQALDEEYLVVWSGFEKDPLGNRSVPWKYLKEPQLRQFLLGRIGDGYVFPINPKWILCDAGWGEVYQAMCAAGGAAEQALDIWLPKASGVRETIQSLSTKHPSGFVPVSEDGVAVEVVDDIDEEMAEWELRRAEVLKRAKAKMRAVARLLILSQHLASKQSNPTELSHQPPVPA